MDFSFESILINYPQLKKLFIASWDQQRFKEELDNANTDKFITVDTFLHALFLTELMLDHTNYSLRIFSGHNIAEVLIVLEDAFLNACKNIASHEGKVRIITAVNAQTYEKTRAKLKMVADNVRQQIKDKLNQEIDLWCTCYVLEPDEVMSPPHFIVCDSKMLKIEANHLPLPKDSDIPGILSQFYFNDGTKTRTMEKEFDNLYTSLTK